MPPRKRRAPLTQTKVFQTMIPFVVLIVAAFLLDIAVNRQTLPRLRAITSSFHQLPIIGKYLPQQRSLQDQVLPPEGFQTKIILQDVVQKMVAAGIIDQQRLADSYSARGGIPSEMQSLLSNTSTTPLHLTKDNATWLINVLWPLGIANRMTINDQSPIALKGVSGFASTGGWTLGRDEGSTYFNKYPLLTLTTEQENRVKTITDTIYRPCCNNSAFFQDCNHGSAALGLVELGVRENLSDQEIYNTVLHFNSFWFPQQYLETAAYFQSTKNMQWNDIDPRILLSKDYSSITGWMTNIDSVISKIPGAIPTISGGSSCST